MNGTSRDLLFGCGQVKLQYRLVGLGDLWAQHDDGGGDPSGHDARVRIQGQVDQFRDANSQASSGLHLPAGVPYGLRLPQRLPYKFQYDNIYITSYFRRYSCFTISSIFSSRFLENLL